MRRVVVIAVVAHALLAAAGAQAAPAPIAASQAWTRPAAAGGNAAGYVTLVNHGGPDLLIGAESPLAQRVELHTSSMTGGVMRMGAEAATPVPAHGQVSFAPGGRHLMFVGLKRPLRVGERAPATLRFKNGGRLKVEFVVATNAPAPEMGHLPGMH
jgi:copper(I)-binding protein